MGSEEERLSLLHFHLMQGESQTVEFKEMIPETARKLAENIASFATSNDGTIYLGIDDSGKIVGLKDLEVPEARDILQRRIAGIVRMVEPEIRVSIEFIQRDSKNIVRIGVPKGSEPIYSVKNIPYLRDLSTSRAATPNEVREIHEKFFKRAVLYPENQQQQFLHDLLVLLADVNLSLSDIEIHFSDPNCSQLQNDLGVNGQMLLRLSFQQYAKNLGLDESLKEVAMRLTDMRAYQFYMGKYYFDRFVEMGKDVLRLIQPILEQIKYKINITYSKTELSKILRSVVDDLRVTWDLGKRNRVAISDLERLKDSFRTLAYRFNRMAVLPESEKYQIQASLFDLSRRLRATSTPTVFGSYELGFDNIRHITPAVESYVKTGEALVNHLNKQ